jgi:GT2 family glycosyltransferase/SAM-dependent methyltransferase
MQQDAPTYRQIERREPESPPAQRFDVRAELAARCLSGSGLEIGALHAPLALPAGVDVRYVDRMSVEDLRKHYPELAELALVHVDVVDDGETLASVGDGSQDFVVANHFLEHCANPIATIETHLRKLAPGGALFYTVPDKRYTFDVNRPVTPLEHMVLDYEEGPERSRRQHYEEWARYVYDSTEDPLRSEETIARFAEELDASDYSIHTHVWTQAEFLKLLLHCRERFARAFDIEAAWRVGIELIVVLRKAGSPRGEPPATLPAGGDLGARIMELELSLHERDQIVERARIVAAESSARVADLRRSPWWRLTLPLRGGEQMLHATRRQARTLRRARRLELPLASLRPELDGGWPEEARWVPQVETPDGPLAALSQPSGTTVAFPLVLPPGARLRAHVGLPLVTWHRYGGGAAFRATLRDLDGRELGSWTRELGTAASGRRHVWKRFTAALPDDCPHEVVLALELLTTGHPGERSPIDRGLWADLALELPRDVAPDATPPHAPAPPAPARASSAARPRDGRPRISILTPVHDPTPAFLTQLLDHVRQQQYEHWQLCIVDDGSRDPRVRALIAQHAAEDERIVVHRNEEAGGISAATNAALALADGEFVALLDHDDVLAHDALAHVAAALDANPDADMLYTDEDHILWTGRRFAPYLKPDWSPELFNSLMFTCHLGVYRRELVEQLGGFRSAFDGSQDYDLVLRLSERTDRIVHVPQLTYHWRVHERSASGSSEAKPYAYDAAMRAIDEHLERTGVAGRAQPTAAAGQYRIVHDVDPEIPVALLLGLDETDVAAADLAERLERCARSWARGTHPSWELVVAAPAAASDAIAGALTAAGLEAARVRLVPADGPDVASRSALLNRAARTTSAEQIVLLECLVEVEADADAWLARLLGYAAQPAIGAVGGKVLAPDGRVEHAGIVIGDGRPLPAHHGADGEDPGHLANLHVAGNWSAVSGVVMTPRATFAALGGLDTSLGALATVDYCLRLRAEGRRIVLVPDAISRRREPLRPVANDVVALERMRARWQAALPRDPYYNPSFWQGRGDFTPREQAPVEP